MSGFNKMIDQHLMQAQLDMLDTLYEGQQQALSQLYKQARANIYANYGEEEPKPEPTPDPESAMGVDADIRMDAANADSVVRRAASMGVVPGRA